MKVYYKGSNPEINKRISTGNEIWDNNIFCADNERSAKLYGNKIEIIAVLDNARILKENTREFKKICGNPKKMQSLLEFYSNALISAKNAGYDIVEFNNQSDVGTVIMNESVIIRNYLI